MKKKKLVALLILICCNLIFIITIIYNSQQEERSKKSSSDIIQEDESLNKVVALTFDDGPECTYTKILLDGLKQRNVKATFFLIGKNIVGNEELVKRMAEEGHLIGNHTYSHVRLINMTKKQALIEIIKNNRLIYQITGKEVKYIRAPFGDWNDSLRSATNLEVVKWDVDPRDWCTEDISSVVNHVVKNVKSGDIILLHDVYESSIMAALQIIDQLSAQGYEFVTLDELIKE